MSAPRRRTAAKDEAQRQEREHGERLLRKDGRVDPAAIYRAAERQRAAEEAEPAAGAEDEQGGDDEELTLTAAPSAGESGAPEVTFTLQRDLDKRLDKYLVDRITYMSRNKLQELIDAGGVRVNGRAGKASTKLRAGDIVVVRVPVPAAEDFEPEDIALDVMYEDEHLIVLNKQADFIVHPARTHTRGTMINALAYHFRFRSKMGGGLSTVGSAFARPGVVHRLDRHTTGCIVFAKSDEAHWQLGNQFMHRTVDKRYVAMTHGHVSPAIDVIDEPIGPHPSREKGYREKYVVRHDHLGKAAVTIYRVLGLYGEERGTGAGARVGTPAMSLVEVELKTGRTHQIRVHFSHRGFALLGDDMYGGKAVELAGGARLERQALHAAVLGFRHPITGAAMRFVAPLPGDLRAAIEAARKGGTAREFDPPPPGSVLRVEELVGGRGGETKAPPAG
ncbi:MAG: RluA family pseudouridine synthase [Phycisphaerales bacterium]